MRDTTAEFDRLVEAAYSRLPPEERVRICAEMFETARAIVEASLPADLHPDERRFRICERFYGELAARALGRERNEK
jgi:hypothetical protein